MTNRSARVALCALLALVSVSTAAGAQQRGTVRGITYTVDTASDGQVLAGIFSSLQLKVAYADGRGRINAELCVFESSCSR